MYPGGFYIPRGGINFGLQRSIAMPFANRGIFSRLFSGIKAFNWKGLINGASKTLNVVNQTIPIIKEAKPAINNVRNVINVVKSFNKETSYRNDKVSNKATSSIKEVPVKASSNGEYPTFFV